MSHPELFTLTVKQFSFPFAPAALARSLVAGNWPAANFQPLETWRAPQARGVRMARTWRCKGKTASAPPVLGTFEKFGMTHNEASRRRRREYPNSYTISYWSYR